MMKRLHLIATLLMAFTTAMHAGDWMKNLPDNIYISQLSIPGTHDSGTGNGVALAAFSQCQDIPVSQQWAAGIRAFDLRPKVKGSYININHGIAATKLRFDDALFLIRDSLAAHPSEFAVVHYHYDTDFDKDKDKYLPMLKSLLERDDMKDFLVPFRRDLTLGDVRGKMLLISRQGYADPPYAGGCIGGWTSSLDWERQKEGWIIGMDHSYNSYTPLYMQDYYNFADNPTGFKEKTDAINQMLDWSYAHITTNPGDVVWVMNFTSAYPGGIPSANGYRKVASYTNGTVINFFESRPPGPTGVIFMDYCVDWSNGYHTRGQELIDTLIANNYKCFPTVNDNTSNSITTNKANSLRHVIGIYSLQGNKLPEPQRGAVNIMKYSDGTVEKVFVGRQ